jgi:hypothetical protein
MISHGRWMIVEATEEKYERERERERMHWSLGRLDKIRKE